MVTAPNKGARSGRRGRRKRRLPMSDINVTPFVDVMLVLLVVFMVTAPLLTVGVPVDLPKAQASLI
ncbi:MAG TPA: protein TolR, partial [Rhodospirillales bacterium]|nr:protein TolR [Rhodospirillales bacterium]